ncbi:KH domain-containing protein [Cryptosporidium muris RN66]|uniref:KH domain-containing protein n=1 Tax=Cryptosporidium muris (strain RN66) TaxID=441375 RepID=B6AFL6_CRYMR|nr:KH domain-containing protein [Cryptosporidium muris RN66]EEA07007.1 KH domain-containing protein [Cryptosporidium muris RN66]|eukprot:XP_002141356.1 KH domain-containing protein [Cryptosporidium muris RN66]
MAKKRPSQGNKHTGGRSKSKSSANSSSIQAEDIKPEVIETVIEISAEVQTPVDLSTLSATQKKNLKRRLKKKSMENNSISRDNSNNKVRKQLSRKEREAMMPKDPLEASRTLFLSNINDKLRSLVRLSTLSMDDVLNKKDEQEAILNELLTELSNVISIQSSQIKRPPAKHLSSTAICEQLMDFENISPENENYDAEFHEHLKELLVTVTLYENYRAFQSSCNDLRSRIEHRLKENQTLAQQAIDHNKQRRLINKVKQLKQGDTFDAEKVITTTFELPINRGNLVDVLFNSSSKLAKTYGKKCGVLIEKSNGNSIHITGQPDDVRECWNCIKSLDVSSREVLNLDPKVIRKLFSINGPVNLKSLQNDHSVIITREGDNVLILGSLEGTKSAVDTISKINDYSSNSISISVPLIIAKALQFNFLPTVRNIERETGTSVRIQFGYQSRGASPANNTVASETVADSKIVILGKVDGCECAKSKLSQLIKTFVIEDIQADSKAVRKLFSPPGKDSSEDANSGRISKTIIDGFSRLRDSNTMGILRIGSSVVMVGPSNEVKVAKPILLDLLERAKYQPSSITIHKEQLRILNRTKRGEVEESTGVEISTIKKLDNRTVQLEIFGSDEERSKAEKLLKDILNNEAYMVTISIDDSTYEKLFSGQRTYLRKFISSFPNIQILPGDRKNRSIVAVGIKDEVITFKDKMEKFNEQTIQDTSNQKTETIDIPHGKVGMIIGTKGSVLNDIRNKSNCELINIPKNTSYVILKGTEEQCSIAKNLIYDILTNSQSNTSTTSNNDLKTENISLPKETIKFDEKCFPTLSGTNSIV